MHVGLLFSTLLGVLEEIYTDTGSARKCTGVMEENIKGC